MIDEQDVFHFSQQLLQGEDVATVLALMDRIGRLADAGELTPPAAYRLYLEGFRCLQDITTLRVEMAQAPILDRLVPVCLLSSDDTEVSFYIAKCRDSLTSWIEQYSELQQQELRQRVLGRLLPALQSDDAAEAACYTIATIGFRRDDIVTALKSIVAQHDGDRGDVALTTLIGLGVPDAERGDILDELHRRAADRQTDRLLSALWTLADPASLPTLHLWLQQDEQAHKVEHDFPTEMILQAIAAIADNADTSSGDSREIQDRVWALLETALGTHMDSFGRSVYMNGGLAPACESPGVIPFLLGLRAADDGATALAAYHRYLLGLRLLDCVRPRHLEGWSSKDDRVAQSSTLYRDAMVDSGEGGLSPSMPGTLKVNAWHLLLNLQDHGALASVEEALAQETSPVVRYQVCELLACFRYDVLPPVVRGWVTSRYELTDPDTRDQGAFRSNAIDVVHSAASLEAFDTLLNSGLSIRGDAYRDVATALGDIAVTLTYAGDWSITPRLIRVVLDEGELFRRVPAAAALLALAAERLSPQELAEELEPALLDERRLPYERSLLLRAMEPRTGAMSDARGARLTDWARDRDDWLGWRSLEILAERGLLATLPHLMHSTLGLVYKDGEWEIDSAVKPIAWAGVILGLLYLQSPSLFDGAVAGFLLEKDWAQATQLLDHVQRAQTTAHDLILTPHVADALIVRLYRQQNAFSGETDLISVALRLLPDRLVTEMTDRAWANWRPEARVALADALGEAAYSQPEATDRAVRTLQSLARDAHYAVRRAAYRGMACLSPQTLQALCEPGSKAPHRDVRQRAAEACVWLSDASEQHDLFLRVFRALKADTEPSVREVATRAREERRERLWARAYVDCVRAVAGARTDNADVLQAWAYGEALTRVGDDTTIRELRRHSADSHLPPHVRHWLRYIAKNVRKRWDDVTKKWPDPWTMIEGRLDAGQGEIELPDGGRQPIPYVLWSQPAQNLDAESGAWGGIAEYVPMGLPDVVTLYLHNGEQRPIIINTVNSSGSAEFTGNGPYPL